MRLIFAGTPEFAATALAALARAKHDIKLVLTQPDRPAGRGMAPNASAVKRLALEYALPLAQPASLKSPTIRQSIKAQQPDVMVVAAYGLILPKAVLAIPRLGCINIHASLLPRWRGAAPIQRAIEAGDLETGISIMQMDAGLDTGPLLMTAPLPIASEDTAQTLHDKLAYLGAHTIVEALHKLERGELTAKPQEAALASYAAKLTKAEAAIDWSKSADEIAHKIRALNPFPVAQTAFKGETWRIWRAHPRYGIHETPGKIMQVSREGILVACAKHALLLEEIQKAGGKRLTVAQFLTGNAVTVGEILDMPNATEPDSLD